MVEITCSAGHIAFVDDEDADLAALRWTSVVGSPTRVYPCRQQRIGPRSENKRRFIYMHRAIADRMGLEGHDIDHIDGNTLNNRRSNLRGVSRSENLRNLGGAYKNSKSGALGVNKAGQTWMARIRVGDTRLYLGRFKTQEEAVIARLEGEKKYWGVQPRRAKAHA